MFRGNPQPGGRTVRVEAKKHMEYVPGQVIVRVKAGATAAHMMSTLPTKASDYLQETDYAAWSGTSMATPHVAGAAALVFAQRPTWSPAQVKQRLTSTTHVLTGMGKKKHTSTYGSGLLDLQGALA